MSRDLARGTMEMSAAMLISGTIGWFVLMSGQPVLAVVFWRCLFGALTLFLVCGMLGLLKPSLVSRKVLGMAALGGVAIVLNWLCLFQAYSFTSISVATIVYNTQPFMLLALGAAFLGDRITTTKILWLCLSFAGMLLIVLSQGEGPGGGSAYLAGIALALAAAFFYAIASILTKRLKGTPPHLIALVQVVVGVVMLAPFTDFSSLPANSASWSTLVAMGVLHTGLMYYLLYGAIQRLPTHVTGALSFIYPVAAVAVDMIAFNHVLRPVQIAGAALILLAAAGMTLGWRFAPWGGDKLEQRAA